MLGINWSPSVVDGDDPAALVSEGDEHGMRQVEMLLGRVAPPAQRVLRAVVRRRDGDGGAPRKAVLGGTGVARKCVASAAGEPRVEQRRTECRGVRSIASGVQIAIPTCTACTNKTTNTSMSKCSPIECSQFECAHTTYQFQISLNVCRGQVLMAFIEC